MRKAYAKAPLKAALVLVLIGLMVLAACTPTEETPPTPTPAPPTETPTEAVEPDPEDPPGEGEGPAEPTAEAVPAVCEPAPLPELPVSPVSEDDWIKGADPENAEITIFEYSDFECPGCAGMYPVLQDFSG